MYFVLMRNGFGFVWSEPKQAKAFVRGEFYTYLLGLDPDKREDVAHGSQVMIFMYCGARPGEVYKLLTRDVFIGKKAVAITLRNRKNGGLLVFFVLEKELWLQFLKFLFGILEEKVFGF